MTLGQYLKFNDSDYPVTLEFNGFYYYENIEHKHILVHLESRKQIRNLRISTKLTLINQLNKIFNLNVSSIIINDPKGVMGMLYIGSKDSNTVVMSHDIEDLGSAKSKTYELTVNLRVMFPNIPQEKLNVISNIYQSTVEE